MVRWLAAGLSVWAVAGAGVLTAQERDPTDASAGSAGSARPRPPRTAVVDPPVRAHLEGAPAVGDSFAVILEVRLPDGRWLRLPDVLPTSDDVESLRPAVVRRRPDGTGGVWWRARYPALAWRPGTLELDSLEIRVEGEGGPRRVPLPSVEVRERIPSDVAAARPPRVPSGDAPAPWRLLTWIPLAAAALSGAGWLRAKRREARGGSPTPGRAARAAPGADPREIARGELADALRRALAAPSPHPDPARLYGGVTRPLRRWLALRHAAWGEDLTSGQLLAAMEARGGADGLEPLRRLLSAADGAKFAGRAPADVRRGLEELRAWVAAAPAPGATGAWRLDARAGARGGEAGSPAAVRPEPPDAPGGTEPEEAVGGRRTDA